MEINIKQRIDRDGMSPPQRHPIPGSEDREISPDLAAKTWPQRTEVFPQSSLPLTILLFLFVPLINFLSWVMTFLPLFIKLSLGLRVKQRPGIVIAADSRYKRTGGRELKKIPKHFY